MGTQGGYGQVPAICPNGELSGSGWYSSTNGFPNYEAAFYNTGYNPGACGGGLNLFESDQEDGLPPDYESRACPGQNLP